MVQLRRTRNSFKHLEYEDVKNNRRCGAIRSEPLCAAETEINRTSDHLNEMSRLQRKRYLIYAGIGLVASGVIMVVLFIFVLFNDH